MGGSPMSSIIVGRAQNPQQNLGRAIFAEDIAVRRSQWKGIDHGHIRQRERSERWTFGPTATQFEVSDFHFSISNSVRPTFRHPSAHLPSAFLPRSTPSDARALLRDSMHRP